MILITGGAFQGKLEFAEKLALDSVINQADIADGEADPYDRAFVCPVVNHLELYVKRMCMEGKDAAEFINELWRRNPAVVVIACEVGCGIVPAAASDRLWREAAGRACISAAGKAESVYLVNCGIPLKIK